MGGKVVGWGTLAIYAALLGVGIQCGGAEPIVYTERVPYEWELWELDAGSSADANDGAPSGEDPSGPETDSPYEDESARERTVFPPESFWNKDISKEPLDPRGQTYLASIGLDASLRADFTAPEPWSKKLGYGIPYQVVGTGQKKVPVDFLWAAESDPGPYPIPDNPLIERGPDRHLIVIDQDEWVLYELYHARLEKGGWKADSGAIFDLKSTKSRPAGWTSADAAGLAIFPGLVRPDEVLEKGAIHHALRFTVKTTQKAYVWPASHYASNKTDPDLPPMGMWVRLKSDYSTETFSSTVQVILEALKKHGMILADNGSNFFISGVPDKRWKDYELKELRRVKGRDLEVIKTGELVKP